MQAVFLFVLAGLIGGIAVGLQSPLASLIGQRLGILESSFILHFGGAIASAVLLVLIRGGGEIGQWRTMPWYALIAGAFGLVIIGAINFTIPKLGTTTTIALVVTGQLLVGVIVDHFGLLDVVPRALDLTRIAGIGVLLLGVYLIMR